MFGAVLDILEIRGIKDKNPAMVEHVVCLGKTRHEITQGVGTERAFNQ